MQVEDELQSVSIDAGEETAASDTETQSQEAGAELATAPDAGQDKKPEGDDDEKAQDAINKQHRKFRDEERAHDDTKAQLEAAQEELRKSRGDDVAPAIPPVPDPYDENFEALVAARDTAIAGKAAWDARQTILAEQTRANVAEVARLENVALEERAQQYGKRATELNVSGEALQQAANVVAGYGLSNELVDEILEDGDGPLITQYLATDLATLDALARMPLHKAVLHLEREVRPKAMALRPKTSDAPNPPDSLTGGGVKEEDPIMKGVTID